MNATLLVALVAAASAPQNKERKGPLAGLPSAPGPHVAKINSLADDSWLNLGSPAPDAKWGRALGRSWSPKMPYAPDLRGAFLMGEGNHGWYNAKTRRYMDDLWFYDIHSNRWVCAYPGADIDRLDFTINKDGFTATQEGDAVPISVTGHAYELVTYDTDLKRFLVADAGRMGYGTILKGWEKRGKTSVANPWHYDTLAGKWGRPPIKEGSPVPECGPVDILMYVPTKKKVFFHASSSGRNTTYFYDATSNTQTQIQTRGPKPPFGGDMVACYDSRRDRICLGQGKHLWFFEVATQTWVDPKPQGEPIEAIGSHDAVMTYDAANDKVVIVCGGWQAGWPKGKVYIYDPAANTTAVTPGAMPADIKQMNGFYDPVLNVHFIHAARDNVEGVMWTYRYRAPRKR